MASSASPALAVEASIDAEAQLITSDLAPLDVGVIPFVSDGQSDGALDEAFSQEQALTVDEENAVEEPEGSEVEEEWPSLGLDVEVKEQAVDVEVEKQVEDSVLSEGKEEWPSIKSIPGLELSQSQPSSEISKSKKSPTSLVNEDASEASSLGELRFQDD